MTMTGAESDAVVEILVTCENPPKVEVWTTPGATVRELRPEPRKEPESSFCGSARRRRPRGQRVQVSLGGGRGFRMAIAPSAEDWDKDGVAGEQ